MGETVTALRALTPVQQLCPNCLRALGVACGVPRKEPCITTVATREEWKRGAVVTCVCGADVYCVPHLELG